MSQRPSLHEVGIFFGTDKSTFHMYMDFYERNIDRNAVKNFLEIGVQDGRSMRTWRSWFNDECRIEGWDIEPFDVDGCVIKYVDQENRSQITSSIEPPYDLVIDDGAHTPKSMETSFSCLFKYAKMYIIEDLHAWFLGYKSENDKISTVDLLEKIQTDGWNSIYSLPDESEYISKNAELVDLFYRGDRNNPLSMSAIILNKELSNA